MTATTVDIDSLPSPLKEWLIELLHRQERIIRAKADGDGIDVRLRMKRDGEIMPPKISTY